MRFYSTFTYEWMAVLSERMLQYYVRQLETATRTARNRRLNKVQILPLVQTD